MEPAAASLPTDRGSFRIQLQRLHEHMTQRKAHGVLRFALHYNGQGAAKIIIEGLVVEILL